MKTPHLADEDFRAPWDGCINQENIEGRQSGEAREVHVSLSLHKLNGASVATRGVVET